MQLPVTAPQRPWPLPRDLDLFILSHLSREDCMAFARASRACRAAIAHLDKELFANASLKPERFRQIPWRMIANNSYRYPKTKKCVKRSTNPSLSMNTKIEKIGQMIAIRYKKETRLIDYKANLFRILPEGDKLIHASFLSALVFRKGRYEICDQHCQTPIKMPEGVQTDPSNPAILCFEGEKAAMIVSSEGKKRLALADRSHARLLESDCDGDIRLYSLSELLALVDRVSLRLLGYDGSIKKTLAFKSAINKCELSGKEFWIATQREIFVYDLKSLQEKKVFPIANPNVIYVNGYLVEYKAHRFIVTGEKIAYSDPLNDEAVIDYYKEVNGLMHLKINQVAYVYDLKENKLSQIDTGVYIGSDHFWIENHLILVTGHGETYKMVG